MTHRKEDVQRIAELNSTFMSLNDKGKDSALTILRALSFAQAVMGTDTCGMTQSMSRIAHCIDNGPMEGFWGILKQECYYGKRFTCKQELVQTIEHYIRYYNTRRVQRNLGILTPWETHQAALAA